MCIRDRYQAYHDEEWGVPQRDARQLFEMLLLEGAQAGLSWITVLKKRERYRQVLHGFDPERLARLTDEEIELLMQDPGIIRNRLKLKAVRQNAQAWLKLDDPVAWLWSFVGLSLIHISPTVPWPHAPDNAWYRRPAKRESAATGTGRPG